MSERVVVIGAGVNGLVAAHTLARAGHSVLVLERRVEADATPDLGWVPPQIVRTLGLEGAGLMIERPDPWITAPLGEGGRLELWHDLERSVAAIRRVSPADAASWPAFAARMRALAGLLETIAMAPPPNVLSRAPGDLMQLAGLGLKVRGLGRQGIVDLLRIVPMSVAELLDDWFEHDVLKGVLAAAAVRDLAQGPRAGGTAFALLHHHAGSGEGVFRPARSNLAATLAGLPGVEIRRGAAVTAIAVGDGGVTGVVLESGEEIAARLVCSELDARRTLLELVDPGWLDPEVVAAVRRIRSRGVTARVTLSLDRAPGFITLAVAPSLDFLERAADDAKYRRVSRRPYLEARARPSGGDGRHIVDVHLQYAPHSLAESAWDAPRRAALADLAVATLSEHEPGLAESVVERAAFSPVDLERQYGWPEGQAAHAELALDQALFMRPTPALARYRTPVGGLYLCGPGMHPGPGAVGAAGLHAGRMALKDLASS